MFDNNLKIKKLILLAGDLIAMYVALFVTLIFRYGYPLGDIWSRHLASFIWVFLIWLIVMFINGSYELKNSHNNSSLIIHLIKTFTINLILSVVFFYFFNPFIETIRPQKVLLVDTLASLVLLFIWRKMFYSVIESSKIVNRVLIIGESPLGELLKRQIEKRKQLGYQAVNINSAPENLKQYCLDHKIDILVNVIDFKKDEQTAKKIFECLSLGVDVYNINSFYEKITGQIPVEYIEHSWFLENLSEHSKKVYESTKRLTDIIIAIIGMVISLPFLPFIVLLIKVESAGPIIFKQTRTGKNGKDFLAMKFRSMVNDAEKNGPQWAQKKDPRVTRFGSIMRKTRIDEIPQLINILKGEMSFVGPRPERPEFIKTLSQKIPFYNERLLVKPGLAGWAQLNGPAYGGSEEESLEKVRYDLYYVKNRSIFLDLSIILKTIKIVFSGKGQ